jgi:hypothetical protein
VSGAVVIAVRRGAAHEVASKSAEAYEAATGRTTRVLVPL